MTYHMISYDIEGGISSDYDAITSAIEKKFTNNCKILTTTFVIISNSTSVQIRDFVNTLTSKKINLFVATCSSSAWSISDKTIKNCVDNLLK